MLQLPSLYLFPGKLYQHLERAGYQQQQGKEDLQQGISFYDREIRDLQQEIAARLTEANDAVLQDIDRKNLFFLGAFGTNTIGLLMRIFVNNRDVVNVDFQTFLGIIAPSLRSVAYTSGRLVNVIDPTRTCGAGDYQSILQEYSMFTHMSQLFDSGSYGSLSSEYHPLFLKYKASEFGQELKNGLGCVIQSGIPASDSLVRTIDQLVCAIEDRLTLTKKSLKGNHSSHSGPSYQNP